MTITHPYHPLSGQQCEIIRIRRGLDPDLIVRLRDGSHAAIAMSWTDYGGEPALTAAQNGHDLPLLDLQGLRQIAHLIENLRQQGRGPKPPSPPRARSAHRTLPPGNT